MTEELRQVWVVDSNTIFRKGLIGCLSSSGIGVAGDSAGLPQRGNLRHVDVLVTELDHASLVAATAVRVALGGLKLIGIATSEEIVEEAVNAGFSGLLLRSELTPERFVGAVRAVISGAGSMPMRALSRLLTDPGLVSRPRSGHGILTQREVAVLELLSKGGSTREIAGELNYSERTVKNIVHDTLTKLNCRTRTQAVAVITRQGMF